MITVQAEIKATLQKVWQYWTTPEHIINWCHASDDWHVTHATNEPVAGGKFCTGMAAKDSSAAFDWEGNYDEVIDFELIKYHMADGRKVEVTFKENKNRVQIIEKFDPENENSEELQQQGWQAILNNFKDYVEAN